MISKDLLFYTLAVTATAMTVFFCWFMWYLISIVRSFHRLVADFRDRLVTIDEILQTIKDKLTSTHAQLSFLTEGVKQLISIFMNRRAKRRSSTRASSSADEF
jgi:hypothetical protein